MRGCGYSLISAAKVCDCDFRVVLTGSTQVCGCVVELLH